MKLDSELLDIVTPSIARRFLSSHLPCAVRRSSVVVDQSAVIDS